MKRYSNIFSCTGLSPTEKELRRMEQSESMSSIVSGASVMSENIERKLDRALVFENLGRGPMRSAIVVDVLKCDGEDFKGTITPTEAKNIIFKETLNLDRKTLHGIKVEYKGNPVISFLL